MTTPTLDEMYTDLQAADAAGDKELATAIASRIREAEAGSSELAKAGPVERFNLMQRRMGKGRQGDTMEKIREAKDRLVYEAGGRTVDLTGSPFLGSMVHGYADAATDPLTYIGGAAGKAVKPLAEAAGRDLMWSALKPDKFSRESGDAMKAVKTLLEEGVNVTQGGVNKLTGKIDALDKELDALIKGSKAKLLNTDVLQELRGVMQRYEAGTMGERSLDKIREVADKLLNHKYFKGGNEMAVQDAQAMKRQNYRELGETAYGSSLPEAAERDALKGVNRGIRVATEKVIPESGTINQAMGRLINARDMALDRAMVARNRDPLGITKLINPAEWPQFLVAMADRSELGKSILARLLHNGVAPTAGGIGAGVGGGMGILDQ